MLHQFGAVYGDTVHKSLNSLLTKFHRIDGLRNHSPTRSDSNGSQIQSLTANVRELMKPNEDLKWKVSLEGTSLSKSWCSRNDNDNEAKAQEIVEKKLKNISHNQLQAVIK